MERYEILKLVLVTLLVVLVISMTADLLLAMQQRGII